jgi:bisphosphoglycerate-dependent phosphoglycerate mutase
MVVSSKEKKELVIKLIEQGVPQKEIAEQAHLSFSTITKIRRELEGDTTENNKKAKSIQAQVFMLFEKNKTLVQVAIKLDITYEEILKIHSDYLVLQHRNKVDCILKEHKNNLGALIKFFNILMDKKINITEVNSVLDLVYDIDSLIIEKDDLEFGIQLLRKSLDCVILEYRKAKKELINLKYYN